MFKTEKTVPVKLLEELNKGKEYTAEELATLVGASLGTVKMHLNYLLVKNGKVKEIKKNLVSGVTKYSL